MMTLSSLMLLASACLVAGQRPPFAGTRPIGFPDTPNRTTTEGLGDRFGEGTTERLPLEANGDRDLIDRLSKLPIDKQPFWFINWQALEEHRKNPQTYPQRPNVFVDPITSNLGNRFSNTGSEISTPDPATVSSTNSNSENVSSNNANINTELNNTRNTGSGQTDTGIPTSNSPKPDSGNGILYSNSGNSNSELHNVSGSSKPIQQAPNSKSQFKVPKNNRALFASPN